MANLTPAQKQHLKEQEAERQRFIRMNRRMGIDKQPRRKAIGGDTPPKPSMFDGARDGRSVDSPLSVIIDAVRGAVKSITNPLVGVVDEATGVAKRAGEKRRRQQR